MAFGQGFWSVVGKEAFSNTLMAVGPANLQASVAMGSSFFTGESSQHMVKCWLCKRELMTSQPYWIPRREHLANLQCKGCAEVFADRKFCAPCGNAHHIGFLSAKFATGSSTDSGLVITLVSIREDLQARSATPECNLVLRYEEPVLLPPAQHKLFTQWLAGQDPPPTQSSVCSSSMAGYSVPAPTTHTDSATQTEDLISFDSSEVLCSAAPGTSVDPLSLLSSSSSSAPPQQILAVSVALPSLQRCCKQCLSRESRTKPPLHVFGDRRHSFAPLDVDSEFANSESSDSTAPPATVAIVLQPTLSPEEDNGFVSLPGSESEAIPKQDILVPCLAVSEQQYTFCLSSQFKACGAF